MKFNLYPNPTTISPGQDTTLMWSDSEGAVKQPLLAEIGVPVDTIADMKAIDVSKLVDGAVINVKGYSSADDGGGGGFQYFASSTDTLNIGTVFAPTSGPGRFIRMFLGQGINVKWFGATGDGSSDDTVSIAAAIAYATDINVIGGKVYFPPNNTYLCHIALLGSINAQNGENGLLLSGYGAVLKGRNADNSIIQINNCVPGTPDPTPASGLFVNGLVIEGFTVDMGLMNNATTTYFLAAQRSYDSCLRDISIINEPNAGGALYLGNETYTYTLIQVHHTRHSIQGYNSSTNLSSAHNFHGCTFRQAIITNSFSITYLGCTVQGSLNKFVITASSNITITGCDIERSDAVGYAYEFVSQVVRVYSFGNTLAGYDNSTYASGVAPYSMLLDRPAFGGAGAAGLGSVGGAARADGTGLVSITTTGATVIYPWLDVTPASGSQGIFLVSGDNGSDGFSDLVVVAFGVAMAIAISDIYGTPPTRAYTYTSSGLKVAVSSVATGNYNIRVAALEQLHN